MTPAQETRNNGELWIDRYAPKTIEELAINKKKVAEFLEMTQGGQAASILLLHGPPGSCKNAMIQALSSQFNHKVVKFSDVKTLHLDDIQGERKQIGVSGGSTYYPGDLLNLIDFIRTASCSSGNTRARPAFSSFAKKSAFAQTKNSQVSNEVTRSQDSLLGNHLK